MDYEKAAQDLFEKLLETLARYGDAAQYCNICAKYPQLLAKFERRVEKEAEKIQLPEGFAAHVKENLKKILDSPKTENRADSPCNRSQK